MIANSRMTMGLHRRPINLFFLAVLVAGCSGLSALWAADPPVAGGKPAGAPAPAPSTNAVSSPSTKKDSKPKKASDRYSVIRYHLETTDDGNGPKAEVLRSRPQLIPIEKMPFFDERDVAAADLIETPDGGFILQVEGTTHGRNAMEMATVSANGRRVAIYAQWMTDTDTPEIRWIAAPMVRGTVRNGTLRFSVDCDRSEAQMLVDGLNNVAVKLKNRPKIKSDPDSTVKGASKKSPVNSKSGAADLINQNTRP
ncbi:MAG: hypothetical protein JNL10_19720 [Verrucomicrobiales bacterium]|nr:hypothetical protein [Verrucomicrobiales bacterium]